MATTYELSQWNVDDVFPEAETGVQLESLETLVKKLENSRPELAKITPKRFAEIINVREAIEDSLLYKIAVRLWLKKIGDPTDKEARDAMNDWYKLKAEVTNRIAFFEQWLAQLPDSELHPLAEAVPRISEYIGRIRRKAPYTLSEKEEKEIELEIVKPLADLQNRRQDMITDFKFPVTIGGKELLLSESEIQSLTSDPDRGTRVRAYDGWIGKFSEHSQTIGKFYLDIISSMFEENIMRCGYPRPISAANLENDLPDEVVELILRKCRENSPVFHDYFEVKRNLLDLEEMTRYDVTAPATKSEREFTYDEAVKLVLASLEKFSQKASEQVKRIFDARHVDARPIGTRFGGQSAYASGTLPYAVLDFTGKVQDAVILAHEVGGHGLHNILVAEQSPLTLLPLPAFVEIPGAFAEQLLLDYLLEHNPESAASVSSSTLDRAWWNTSRQAYFASFEIEAHDRVPRGANVQGISRVYLDLLKEQFGPKVSVPEIFRHEWLKNDHMFNMPFKNYSYTMAELVAYALYAHCKKEGAEGYLAFLSAGGSKSPGKMLSDLGIDMRSPQFWQTGFDSIKQRVDQLDEAAA